MPGFIRGLALPDREILASAVLDRRNAILLARASFADGAPAEVRAALGRRLRQSGQSLPVTTETHGGTPMATVTDVGWELSCQYTAGRRATVLRGCVTVADTCGSRSRQAPLATRRETLDTPGLRFLS